MEKISDCPNFEGGCVNECRVNDWAGLAMGVRRQCVSVSRLEGDLAEARLNAIHLALSD